MSNLDLRAPLPLLQTPHSDCGCCTPRTTSGPATTTNDTENGINTVTAFAKGPQILESTRRVD